ncbi:MAG TPA: AAA family ATPase [Kamptonema sp.]|nr:AAA family ATPase [Kamptonema sp.]
MHQIPGYRIFEQLYSGVRTAVYRAFPIDSQTPVILKLLQKDYPTFSELIQFRNQYTIGKNLDIPGIVKTYGLEFSQNRYILSMEDFGGISLEKYLIQQGKHLPIEDFLNIACHLATILQNIHQQRIIHKDIKPGNILINPNTKEIRITDFSISSLLPRETQEIQNPNILEGTLAYISPEQTGRMNRGIDYRTDFYSLGVTFYEILTGKLPFVSEDAMELVHSHLAKQAVPIHQVNPEIPIVLSENVSKLMSKNAEDRYQNALGLKHDLEICLEKLQRTGNIEIFKLGERDISDRFTIPEKLYGREKEVANLLQAFERVSIGTTEMMLVAGFSGIGKTVVINEVHKPIVRHRGYFIKGKYDQFQRNIPFSAFVQAFRDLMGQLLSESDPQLQRWKTRILETVGDNGQVLIDVIPELENIIGKQSPAPELSGSAAQNRFNLLFQKFVQVFTSIEHPLVMFLDDWQWADLASLNLLHLLMQDTGYLLILGAYRNNEVSPVHPFILTVEELVKTGATVNTITLPPLSEPDMNRLVADALNCEICLAQPLTKLVYKKTQGNPFFATQFLKSLHEDGLISFDSGMLHWQCDIAKVKVLAITDDVVEFMALQLQKLPEQTQDILKLAACIGAEFDLNTLVIVSKKSAGMTATALWKALQEGLVIPTTKIYKFFTQSESEEVFEASANPTYRFLHDRVQQAAYSLIPDDRKKATHYQIGQQLLKNISSRDREERIFEIVNQINIAVELIEQPTEREEVAQLNLIAGCKAKNSTAYSAAVKYFAVGRDLLASDRWQSQYNLTLALYVEATEAAYLNTDIDQMEHLAETVLKQAKTALDTIKVYGVRINARTSQGQLIEAITTGLTILKQFEIDLPESPDLEEVARVGQETQILLGSKKPADLLNLPEMTNPQILGAMQILNAISVPAYLTKPNLNSLIIMTQMNLSMTYGNAPISALGYSSYGLFLCAVAGDIEHGYEFGQLALNLLGKFKEKKIEARVLFVISTFIIHWKVHIKETLNLLQNAYSKSWESGSLMESGYAAYAYGFHAYFMGDELSKLEEEMTAYSKVLEQIDQKTQLKYNELYRQSVLNLLGQTSSKFILMGEANKEEQLLAGYQQANDQTGLWHFFLLKLMLCYLFHEFEQILKYIERAEYYSAGGKGMCNIPTFHFYASLARLAVLPNYPKSEQENLLQQVAASQKNIEKWATYASVNNLHKYHLIEAEKHRIFDEKTAAIEFYDLAIKGAKENGYIQEEALSNELAAKFYLNWDKEKVAAGYMQEAYYCYARWGAKAKVTDLEKCYPQLLAPILLQKSYSSTFLKETIARETIASIKTSAKIYEVLDFATLLKVFQAISGEIELERLLTTLLEIVIINAGASKCILLLKQELELKLVALVEADRSPQLLPSIPLESSPDIAISLVNVVKRTLKPLVLANAGINSQFAADSYIQKYQPKSILCIPILHQGQLIGVLYLENNLVAGAFTSDRVQMLNLLCAQAAISLENARLYRNSQNYAQELTQSLAKLQATETRFQNLANNIPGMVYQFRLGADGSVSTPYVSSGCLDLYNVEPELVMTGNFSLYGLHHPDDNPAIEKAIAYSAQNMTPFEQEWRIILPSGTVKWIQSVARPERQEDGAILWDGVVIDISDRKHIEAEQTRLLSILESTSDLIGTADPTGKNLYLNRAWRHLLGLENETVAKGTEIPKYHPEWATEIIVNQGLPEAIHSGIWVGETAVIDGNGREIPVSQLILSHKSRDGDLEYFSTIIRDISDRKQAELAILQKSQELEQALQALQQAQLQMIQSEKMSALGNLVAGIAHEMNNPLGFIAASLQQVQPSIVELIDHLKLYQENFPNPSDEILNHAEEIDLEYSLEDLPKAIDSMEMACDRLKNISTSLRTFSRADKDYKVPFNIHEGINSTILILKHRLKANEHRPDIEVVTEYGKIPKIECFPGQLNQVFMNILANAIDALDEASIGRSFTEINAKPNRITITTSGENQVVKITIADNGNGMTEEVKQKIFDHLFTTKGVGKGTGLGLAIAQQIIVEKHQGSIAVNSTEGVGTEFAIALPI